MASQESTSDKGRWSAGEKRSRYGNIVDRDRVSPPTVVPPITGFFYTGLLHSGDDPGAVIRNGALCAVNLGCPRKKRLKTRIENISFKMYN